MATLRSALFAWPPQPALSRSRRRCRPRAHQPQLRAVTSHATMRDGERALAPGCDAYLSTPIDRTASIALIERFLPSSG